MSLLQSRLGEYATDKQQTLSFSPPWARRLPSMPRKPPRALRWNARTIPAMLCEVRSTITNEAMDVTRATRELG